MSLRFNPFLIGNLQFDSGGGDPTIGQPVLGSDANSVLIVDSANKLADVPLTAGQLLIGRSGATPVAATLTGTTNQVNVTSASGSITLSLPQNIDATATPTFSNLTLTSNASNLPALFDGSGTLYASSIPLSTNAVAGVLPVTKGGTGQNTGPTAGQLLIGTSTGTYNKSTLTGTANQVSITSQNSGNIVIGTPQDIGMTSSPIFANLSLTPSGSLDTTTAGTLAVGTGNATVINIGNSAATVNIVGTVVNENVTNLNVANKTITINTNGATGSASNVGLAIEEAGAVTGYFETSGDRGSFLFKAPGTTGEITLTPGGSNYVINQGSHNPLTLGATSPGLSLSNQVLSSQYASATQDGVLAQSDYQSFSAKQPAGNYITALTGDVTAAGPGSAAATLATVNASPGTTGSASSTSVITTDAKGRVTSNTSTPIQITESQVTNLTTDLAAKQNKVNGDIAPTSATFINNGTSPLTGFSFASTVSSFDALVNIQIAATTNTYTTVRMFGTRKNASDWSVNDLEAEYTGDAITGLNFAINNSSGTGTVTITVGNITGFTSGTAKFRATTLS